MSVLVTGGAGYIGSHTCVELLNICEDVIIADNLSNSNEEAIRRVERITGKKVKFYNVDLREYASINHIFEQEQIQYVIHFAGLKAVGESVKHPLEYYENNIQGSLVLFDVMKKHNVKRIIFSSSATVYGNPDTVPIKEDAPLSVTNPYGRTKLFLEEILADIQRADPEWSVVLLRYFNPIGAHKSGLIGENPNGIPNNLIPYITLVALKKLPYVKVYGNDYDTLDGTGVRDYVHVVDLAKGHVHARKVLEKPGIHIYNLGTGRGYSVLEVITAFEKVCGFSIPYQIMKRREGDVPACYADSKKAFKELGWSAKYELKDMCEDSWRWQRQNPNGYQ